MIKLRNVYLIKIELGHDSLERICDAGDVLAQNVLEKDANHNYHRAGFHFGKIFLGCNVARLFLNWIYFLTVSPEVVLFSEQCNKLSVYFVTKFRSSERAGAGRHSNEKRWTTGESGSGPL